MNKEAGTRRILTETIKEDPVFDIAGLAATGQIALAKIPQNKPDAIIVDMEMPDLDGLAIILDIRKNYPDIPLVLFAPASQKEASRVVKAISLGAQFIANPDPALDMGAKKKHIRQTLVPILKNLSANMGNDDSKLKFPKNTEAANQKINLGNLKNKYGGKQCRVDILAIGVSTGGPNALSELLSVFPMDFPVPVVVVQHMPPSFTRYLAERLHDHCKINVKEAAEGDLLKPGHAYIAPGNYHIELQKNGMETRIVTHQKPPENSCRPAVDVLFRSVAEVYGPNALAVVLTGMGQDGLRGCELIRECGGHVLVQDEKSSVVWGMPGQVAQAELANKILPLSELAPEILTRVSQERPKISVYKMEVAWEDKNS